MGEIDAVPNVGHVGEDVEHMGPEFLAHTGERAIANLDTGRDRRRRCACIGGNAVGDSCGRGPWGVAARGRPGGGNIGPASLPRSFPGVRLGSCSRHEVTAEVDHPRNIISRPRVAVDWGNLVFDGDWRRNIGCGPDQEYLTVAAAECRDQACRT